MVKILSIGGKIEKVYQEIYQFSCEINIPETLINKVVKTSSDVKFTVTMASKKKALKKFVA